MSKIILLLVVGAFVAVVQGLPHSKPCYTGGSRYPYQPYPYQPYPYQPYPTAAPPTVAPATVAPTTVAPTTAAPTATPAPTPGPALTPEEFQMLSFLYAKWVASQPAPAPAR